MSGFTKRQTGVSANFGAGGTISYSLGSNPSQGDVVCVGVIWYDGSGIATTMTVQDGAGNNYVVESHTSGTTNVTTAGQALQAYLVNAPSNASKTINVTFSNNAVVAGIWIDNFAVTGGTAAYDNGAYASGSSTITTPTIPVAGTNELLYAVATDASDTNGPTGAWSGNDGGEQLSCFAEWILSASSNTAVGFVGSAGYAYNAIGMSFSFSPSGGGTVDTAGSSIIRVYRQPWRWRRNPKLQKHLLV